MKIKFTKPVGSFADEALIGTIHLEGTIDTTACGIPDENWKVVSTKQPLTCQQCIEILKWAKKVAATVKS